MKYIFSCIILLFSTLSLFSQEKWDLERCVSYALENNLTVKQNALSVEGNQSDLKQSRIGLFPTLNGNAGYSVNFGRGIDPQTNTFVTQTINASNLGLSSSMILFNGFQQVNTIKQRQLQLLAGESNLQQIKDQVLLSVVNGFLQVLYTQELMAVSQNALALSQLQLNRSQALEKVGSITRGDVLEIEAQLAQEELSLTMAENNYDLAKLNLTQLLDLDPNQPFEIEVPALTISEAVKNYAPTEVFTRALEINPLVKQSEYNLLIAERAEKITKGGLAPRLTLSGGLNTGYSDGRVQVAKLTPESQQIGYVNDGSRTAVFQDFFVPTFETTSFSNQITENLGQNIGISLFLPIFNGYQTRNQISKAKINRQVADLNLQITQNNLEKTINQLIADRKAAKKRYTASSNSFNSLREAFKYNEEKFKVGLINSVDYNISKTSLARAENTLLQAKFDLIFQTKILDYYMGQPITIK
jgi:outer membrane protein